MVDLAKLEGHSRFYYNGSGAWWEDEPTCHGWAGAKGHDTDDFFWDTDWCNVAYTDSETMCNATWSCQNTASEMWGQRVELDLVRHQQRHTDAREKLWLV